MRGVRPEVEVELKEWAGATAAYWGDLAERGVVTHREALEMFEFRLREAVAVARRA